MNPLQIDGPAPDAPVWSLYDYRAVGVAAFFGSPLAGSILMAVNNRRLGRTAAAVMAAGAGTVVTALLLVLAFAVSSDAMRALPIVLMVATMYSAKGLQGAAVEQHVKRGGRLASRWAAFGIGIAVLALIASVVFAIVFAENTPEKVTIGAKDEIEYSGKATAQDARALGQALKAEGFLQDRGVTVLLSRGADGATVSFVVKAGLWDDAKYVAAFEQVARGVAPSVGGLPMKMRLVDSSEEVKKEVSLK